MSNKTETSVEVRHQPDEQRFVICMDGSIAGKADYITADNQRVFIHTEVDPEYGGQGLGVKLITKALTSTVNSGLRIVAVCPFVAAYLKRHQDFAESVDAATPALLEQLRTGK